MQQYISGQKAIFHHLQLQASLHTRYNLRGWVLYGWWQLVSAHEWCFLVERVRNKSTETIWDPAGIQTQDPLNTSQMLSPMIKPLGPLAEEQKTSYISIASAKFQLILTWVECHPFYKTYRFCPLCCRFPNSNMLYMQLSTMKSCTHAGAYLPGNETCSS